MPADYASMAIAELFEQTAAPTPAPGGGSIAALTVGLSAALVTMIARSSRDSWPDAAGIAAQALELAERCPRLAQDDAAAWEEAFAGLQDAVEGNNEPGAAPLRPMLDRSAELPLAIAEAGADVAVLAALAASRGDGALRADAISAALLAHAGARVGAHLVAVNLGTREGDARSSRAAAAERRAARALADAVGMP
ncbi:MAG TPA: cyclodeaminase/cyclohydrolase family protein [Gaiellaceae bacterium]|nr:cyclodeaminase/cyclohydrolase family protein [Gaiellaceae bacterium]